MTDALRSSSAAPKELGGQGPLFPPLPKTYDVEPKGRYSAGKISRAKSQKGARKRQSKPVGIEDPTNASNFPE
jgi:hypothetical protein